MASRKLDFPVFDADNHMYETPAAMTKHIDPAFKGVIDYVNVDGRTKLTVKAVSASTSQTQLLRKLQHLVRKRSTSRVAILKARVVVKFSARQSLLHRHTANSNHASS